MATFAAMVARLLTFGELLFDELPTGLRAGGGPFNTAAHLVALGQPCGLISAVGNDERGRWLRAVAKELGVGDQLLQSCYLESGRVQVGFDAHGEPNYDIVAPVAWDLIRWPDSEPVDHKGQPISVDPGAAALPEAVRQTSGILFWLLGMRSEVNRATLTQVLAQAPADALRAVDVGLRQNFYDAESIAWVLHQANIAKLNEGEFATVCQLLDLEPRLEVLAEAFGLDTLIVTEGPAGASSWRNGQLHHAPAASVANFVDAIGCGDSFFAGYMHARLLGLPETACLEAGNARGAYTAGLAGGLPPHTPIYRAAKD